jgi:hypothetical protein
MAKIIVVGNPRHETSFQTRLRNDTRKTLLSDFTTSISSDMAAAFMEDPTATIASGIVTEHISLEGSGYELDSGISKARGVTHRLSFDNHVQGRRSEIAVFDDGSLQAQDLSRGKAGKTRHIQLRFLDPRPLKVKQVATGAMRAAAGLFCLGLLSALLAYFSLWPWPSVTVGASAALFTASAMALGLFVYRTCERTIFVTASGRTETLSLVASIGCLGACHRLIPTIVEAIEQAREQNPPSRSVYLRQEMQEHYRLRENGAISPEACNAGTKRILNRFD